MSKRGRKIGADGAKSRELLLNIAAKEFAQNGYYETKISTIVKAANVTQPTFYLYFKNKESIFKELVDNFKERLATLTQNSKLQQNLDTLSAQERIKQNLLELFQLFETNKHIARIGFIHSEDSYDIKDYMAKQIEQNLIEEAELGYFRASIDMRTVACSLLGAIERLTVTKLWTNEKTPDMLAQEVSDLFLCGLRKDLSN
ncbi:TetR/AcrR family transcriptional regulator [Sporosarcina sp. PTS2304]|uniref:TetR/AcrR family transcriptional regulator n=1 Tax=Sporosarcina sp. PTS2304 TaxID=2283194 RepID=UPI0013B3B15F|nr:TetR/AcrR family transcriptional regulator [Sporosarcina sp. PTS2304]